MAEGFDAPIIASFRGLYEDGYRCISYEVDEIDNLFTVYLKNFEKEHSETLKCNASEGATLKDYIDRTS